MKSISRTKNNIKGGILPMLAAMVGKTVVSTIVNKAKQTVKDTAEKAKEAVVEKAKGAVADTMEKAKEAVIDKAKGAVTDTMEKAKDAVTEKAKGAVADKDIGSITNKIETAQKKGDYFTKIALKAEQSDVSKQENIPEKVTDINFTSTIIEPSNFIIKFIIILMIMMCFIIFFISIINIIIYIFIYLYDYIYTIFNPDTIIKDTLAYNILKYINVQNKDKYTGEVKQEPYFLILTEESIIKYLVGCIFLIIFLCGCVAVYYGIMPSFAKSRGVYFRGSLNDFNTSFKWFFGIISIFVLIHHFIFYTAIFKLTIFEEIKAIYEEISKIDEYIFTAIYYGMTTTDYDTLNTKTPALIPFDIDEEYCKILDNKNMNMPKVNNIINSIISKEIETYINADKTRKTSYIIQYIFLYCMYRYLHDIIPITNINATKLITPYLITPLQKNISTTEDATKNTTNASINQNIALTDDQKKVKKLIETIILNNNIRDDGFLTLISLCNYKDINLIKYYYTELDFMNDEYLFKNYKYNMDDITSQLRKIIDSINTIISNKKPTSTPLYQLFGYFMGIFILNTILIIILLYLINNDNDLMPEQLRAIIKPFYTYIYKFLNSIKEKIM